MGWKEEGWDESRRVVMLPFENHSMEFGNYPAENS